MYSSFLLFAQRAAEKYGIPSRDILIELGKRNTVGGQEDMIEDVAIDPRERTPGHTRLACARGCDGTRVANVRSLARNTIEVERWKI